MDWVEIQHLSDTYAFLICAGIDFCMHCMMGEKRNTSESRGEERLQIPLFSGSTVLRRAIRANIVSFPSQIPILLKQPPADMQWRMVLLYFVRGWASAKIAARFNVPRHRVWKTLNDWSVRALALGYVQVIDPEAFATCCHEDVEYGTAHDIEETQSAEIRPVIKKDPLPFPDAAPAMGAPLTPDGAPVDPLGKGAELIAALDASIAHCEDWRGEFWVRTATLLRDLRTVAAAALDEGGSGGGLPHGLRAREKERVSHAVA